MLQGLLSPSKLKAVKSGERWIIVRDTGKDSSTHVRHITTRSEDPESIDQVIVTGTRYGISDERYSSAYINREAVKQTPHLADDTMRMLKGLPGVTGGDFSSKLNVRGGRRDEVMLMVDGAEIHNGFHFSEVDGLLSALDTNLVDSLDFMTGGMTSDWSNYMSGVIDIRSRDPGLQDEYPNAVGVSFISAFARGAGSFADDKGSWLIAARRGYLDLLLNQIQNSSEQTVPRYADIFSSVRYRLDNATTLSAHLLYGSDSMDYSQDGNGNRSQISSDGKAGSMHAWIGLDHGFSDALMTSSTLSYAQISQRRHARDDEPQKSEAAVNADNRFSFVDIKSNWQWTLSNNQLLRWGVNGSNQHGRYNYDMQSTLVNPMVTLLPVTLARASDFGTSTWNAGAYMADRSRLTSRITAEAGLRFDTYHYPGLQVESRWSPRINAVYRFNSGTEVRAAWGEMYQAQNVNDLQVEDGVSTFSVPEHVTQTVLGFIQPLPADLTLRIDVYQKEYRNLRARYENALDPLEAIPEADWDRVRIDATRARSKGVEMTLRRDVPGSWGGFISYAYGKAEELEDNVWRPRSWDQQHNLSSGLHAAIGKWTLSMAGLYHSGAPTTALSTRVVTLPNGARQAMIYPADRNGARLGSFTRIDMRIGRESQLRHGVLSYYLEIINLLDQKNDYCFELNDYRVFNNNGTPVLDSRIKYGLPLLPSLGFQYQF